MHTCNVPERLYVVLNVAVPSACPLSQKNLFTGAYACVCMFVYLSVYVLHVSAFVVY